MEFFLDMIPPTTTHQQKKVRVVQSGKPVFYEPEKLKTARTDLMDNLKKFSPVKPYEGVPLRLVVKWMFPYKAKKSHHNGEYRITRPDTDNLQKLLKDCMTACGFWKDDALVASETCEKFWADIPGIFVRIETL